MVRSNSSHSAQSTQAQEKNSSSNLNARIIRSAKAGTVQTPAHKSNSEKFSELLRSKSNLKTSQSHERNLHMVKDKAGTNFERQFYKNRNRKLVQNTANHTQDIEEA